MTLLHFGLAAAGLACISIPIIIHLLMRRRRKPVMWGAMRFLLEAYRRQKRRLLIEKWGLLAARCLLIALIALAIGRPLIGALAPRGQGRIVWLLIDDSVSSGTIGPDGRTALAVTKDRAAATISALEGSVGEGARVGLITLAGPARAVVDPPSTDLAAIRSLIEGLQPADSKADFAGAFALLSGGKAENAGSAGRAAEQQAILLSEFREGAADLSADLPDLPPHITLLAAAPADEPLSNVTIEDIRPLRSVVVTDSQAGALAGESVTVRLSRSGAGVDQAQISTVRVRVASAAGIGNEAQRDVRFAPGQREATTVVTLSGAGAAGNGRLNGDHGALLMARIDNDALPADNIFRQPVNVREALRVGVVSSRAFSGAARVDQFDPGAWIRLALRPGPDQGIEVVEIEPAALDQARLASLDALFIPRPDLLASDSWARIRLFVESSGLVIVSPPPDATVHLWPDAMASALDLNWTFPREALVAETGWAVAAPPSSEAGEAGLLTLIAGELEELVKPVRVHQALPAGAENNSGGEVLLTLDNGAALARTGRPTVPGSEPTSGNGAEATQRGRGLVVYLATALDLDWTNLPTRPLMLPLLQEIVRQGVGKAHGSWALVAGDRPATPAGTVELTPAPLDVARESLSRLIVGADGLTTEPIRHAGAWQAVDDRGGLRGLLAVNVDTLGGRIGAQPVEAVGAWLAQTNASITWLGADDEPFETSLATVFGEGDDGAPISLPLLAAALALAVFELFLARWSSHASITGRAVPGDAASGATA